MTLNEMIEECFTRDEIGLWIATDQNIKDFAKLVAASEREEIAQMIDDAPPLVNFEKNELGGCLMCGFMPKLAAKVIRARGEQ
jgi:hypothetical protein